MLFLVLPASGIAQNIMKKPLLYINPTGVILCDSRIASEYDRWIVYSDRDNNPTYSSKNGNEVLKKINFMEAFWVVDEDGSNRPDCGEGRVHIYKYDPTINLRGNNKLNSAAIDYGWVPKNKMLLWENSLIHPTTRFTIKALTINQPESLINPDQFIKDAKEKKLRLFNSPGLESAYENENDIRLFQFLYIFKEDKENNSLLIGKSYDARPRRIDEVLGWISKDIIQNWDHRLAMEPNSIEEAVAERIARKTKTTVFSTEKSARAFQEGNPVKDTQILWNNDPFDEGFGPEKIRLPILETLSDNIVKTGVASNVFDTLGKVVIPTEKYNLIVNQHSKLANKFRKINVIFVMDGTESMSPYFNSVVNALNSSSDLYDNNQNSYRFGAVVYRDYPEENCPQGNKLIERQSLTTYQELTQFLSNVKAGDCMDRDAPEAMYHGLTTALRMFNPDETNILILIGDAGNHENDERHTALEVIDMLAEQACSLLAYQVQSPNRPAYNAFTSQVNDLIIKSVKKIKRDDYQTDNSGTEEPRFLPGGETVYRLNFPEGSSKPGALIFNNSTSGMMSVQVFEKEMKMLFESIDKEHDKILSDLEGQLTGIGKRSKVNPGVYHYLKRIVDDKNLLDLISYDNLQFYAEGYTPISVNAQKHSLYQYVLFISEMEFSTLNIILSNLANGGSTRAEIVENMINVYKQVLTIHYGEDGNGYTKKIISNKNAGDLIKLITGLPSTSDLLQKYTIGQLNDPRVVKEKDLILIQEYLEDKYDSFSINVKNNEKYIYNVFEKKYYWIPIQLLP